MFERFSDRARRVVVSSQEEARRLHHPNIGSEHVLLGLLRDDESTASRALGNLGVDLGAVRSDLESRLPRAVPPAPSGHIPFTPDAKRVLENSLREALQLGHGDLGTEHILLGVLKDRDGLAARVLSEHAVEIDRVRDAILELRGAHGPQRQSPPVARRARTMTPPRFATLPTCAFCGRDLWEVDRFVRGETTVICDQCLAAAHRALEDLTTGRAVPLPARVFGDEPEPGAAAVIARVFRQAFGDPDADPSDGDVIEDEDEVRPHMAVASERAGGIVVNAVHVSRIRFTGPDRAEVRFSTVLEGPLGVITHHGLALRGEGRWRVSRSTIAQILARAGVRLPPKAPR